MMSGMCKKIKTKSCQFSHVMPQNCEEHNPSLTGGKRCRKAGCTLRHPRLCFHHLRGGCFFGKRCWLYHSQHTHTEDMKGVNDQQVNALINKIEKITRELDNLRSEFQQWKAELSEEPYNKKPPDPALSVNVEEPPDVVYVDFGTDTDTFGSTFGTDTDTDGEDEDFLWHSDMEHERGYGGDAVKEPGMDRGTEESLSPQERYDAIMCVVDKNRSLSDTEARCDSDHGNGGYALERSECLNRGCNCVMDRENWLDRLWVCKELKKRLNVNNYYVD